MIYVSKRRNEGNKKVCFARGRLYLLLAKETKRDFEIPSLEIGENGDQLEHQEGITYDICFETSKRE